MSISVIASSNARILRRAILGIACALFILLAFGCAKRTFTPGSNLDESWERAKNFMQRERYVRAQELLRDIMLNYSGSAVVDSAQFFLGLATFQLSDFLVAAEEFRRVAEQYPYSPLCGDAVFFEARSYYEQSPSYALDQTLTDKALRGFQRFLEDYPGHALTDSGYHYLGQCREKLARKAYAAAKLYYDLGEYASVLLYCDVVLENYYDTAQAASAQFLKGRSYAAVKDWERARRELAQYIERNPGGKFVVRARQLLGEVDRRAASDVSASASP